MQKQAVFAEIAEPRAVGERLVAQWGAIGKNIAPGFGSALCNRIQKARKIVTYNAVVVFAPGVAGKICIFLQWLCIVKCAYNYALSAGKHLPWVDALFCRRDKRGNAVGQMR